MRLILASVLMLAGCGTFQLGTVMPQQGKSQDDLQVAMLICKDQAKNEANTGIRVAGSFVAGLTIIGMPLAIAEERRKQREVFSSCMSARGYVVLEPQ